MTRREGDDLYRSDACRERSRGTLLPLAVLTLAALCSAPTRAQDLFPRARSLPLHAPAAELLMVDLDDDGLDDFVVTHEAERQVSILRSGPGGTLSVSAVCDVGLNPVFVTSGDIDGDSDVDLLVVNSGSATISVLLNDGGGSFDPLPEAAISQRQPRVAELADFDGDGRLDLATSDLATHSVSILRGTGGGSFETAERLPVGEKPHSIAAADFDGDGRMDLAVPIFGDATARGWVYWFEGLGDGTFSERPATDLGDLVAARISVSEDFDGDGLEDLCVADLSGSMFHVRNLGDWSFEMQRLPAPARAAGARVLTTEAFLRTVDFDGDGDPDLLAKIERNGELGYRLYESAAGTLVPLESDVLLGRSLRSLALHDLDGDGRLDAIATWNGAAELLVFPGAETPGRLAGRVSIPLDGGPRGIRLLHAQDHSRGLVVFSGSALHVVRGSTLGELGPPTLLPFPAQSFQDMLTADLDPAAPGDEIALAEFVGNRILLVSLDTDGAVGEIREHSVDVFPYRLAAADFDRDGITDLAVAHSGSSVVSILLRPGSRPEAEEIGLRLDLPVDSGQTAIDAADADGDGAADVVVATRESVTLLFGDGGGGFPRTRRFEGFERAPVVKVADVDGDGQADLLIARDLEITILHAVARPDPRRSEVAVDVITRAFDLHDLDGDAELDLVVAGQGRDSILVRRGARTADGFDFDELELYPAGISPGAFVLTDFDRDGAIDCATADFGSRSLSLLPGTVRSRAPVFRRGDIDLDGRLLVTDAVVGFNSLFLEGPPPRCDDAFDVDDDGALQLTDVLALLNYLFLNGSEPPPPGPSDCGEDPTADQLSPCMAMCPGR